MFQKGDQVTIEVDGAKFTGEFVRMYGKKVQIRQADGKLTGPWVEVAVPLKTQAIVARPAKDSGQKLLGKCQVAVLEFLKIVPAASFRMIAMTCDVTIPRAATIVKSLVIKGRLTKTFKEGRNHYEQKT